MAVAEVANEFVGHGRQKSQNPDPLRVAAQSKPDEFVIDGTKPFVYIKFDHIAARKPVLEEENPKGIWLRLVNNYNLPIRIVARALGTGDPGVAVDYAVVPSSIGRTNLLAGRESKCEAHRLFRKRSLHEVIPSTSDRP